MLKERKVSIREAIWSIFLILNCTQQIIFQLKGMFSIQDCIYFINFQWSRHWRSSGLWLQRGCTTILQKNQEIGSEIDWSNIWKLGTEFRLRTNGLQTQFSIWCAELVSNVSRSRPNHGHFTAFWSWRSHYFIAKRHWGVYKWCMRGIGWPLSRLPMPSFWTLVIIWRWESFVVFFKFVWWWGP